MAIKWKIELIKPLETLRVHANDAWIRSMPELEKWMRSELVPMLVNGGNGIVGISQTDFYKFVTSPRGLSELGIEATEPPKLLQAYLTTAFKIRVEKRYIALEFGNFAKLKAATPHPADGTGQLHISSWLEWVYGREEPKHGFVERDLLNPKAQKSIRLGAPLGGLMLPRGAYRSTGLWRFPAHIQEYERQWLGQNLQRIETVMTEKMFQVFAIKLING